MYEYCLICVCRVTSSTMLEDRRDAVRTIKSLSKKFKAEVGSQCIDVLLSVIHNDSMDPEIVGYAIETIWNITELSQKADESNENALSLQFAEEFLKNAENVNMLLGLLEQFDFKVRRPTACLLTTLLQSKRNVVQEAILVSPMSISRVMDLLQDSREVIRNDGLLLLLQLTRSNTQIQKIVAFENAFDYLFAIIRDEGYSDGGIIVQDCLGILHNLLHGNSSNQAYFREATLVQQLVPFFDLKLPPSTTSSESGWSAQKVANVYHMLTIVRVLVTPGNPQQATTSCQKVMSQCSLLALLCSFMFASGVTTEILVETISTVAEVIRGCEPNQVYFSKVETPSAPPQPAMLALLMSMVAEKQPPRLRLAALYCFQCYVYKNDVGQKQIIDTLLPSSTESRVSLGQVLIAGLFGADPLSNWCSGVALSSSLSYSLKPQLLRVQLSLPGKGQVTLLQQITSYLVERSDLHIQARIGLMVLLCVWLAECPIAVAQFLNDAANVPFLTGQLTQSYSSELQQNFRGLCGALLGICLAYNDGGTGEYTPETLRQVIVHRIGSDAFSDCLSQVTRSESYSHAGKSPHAILDVDSLESICFDHSFTAFYKGMSDIISRALDTNTAVPSQPPTSNGQPNPAESTANTSIEDHHSIVTHYKELIMDQDKDLTELKQKYVNLEDTRSKDATVIHQQLEEIGTLKSQLDMYASMKDHREQTDGSNGEVAQLQSTIVSLQRLNDSQRQETASKNVLIEQYRSELEAARSQQQQAQAAISDETAQLRETISQLQAENRALSLEKEELDDHLKALQDSSRPSEQPPPSGEVVELQHQLQQAELAFKDLKDRHETVTKEQDDLFILLAEQESTLRKYRKLMSENGVSYPDDDETGDSEAEDEDEVD